MKLETLLTILRRLAPEELALDNDPVGLLIEPASTDIRSVVVCLDVTRHVAEYAKAEGAELIIAHHPLIYFPIKRLDRSEPVSSTVLSLASTGIGLYAMHTNWDAADGGINDTLAELLGLTGVHRLQGGPEAKLARIGELPRPLIVETFLGEVADSLNCEGKCSLRDAKPSSHLQSIKTVAVCGGAGAGLVKDVIKAGADAFVTSDVRHHEFIDAEARGLLLIDAGHEATEAPGMQKLTRQLAGQVPELYITFCPNRPAK